jgi:hypothetical protein
MSTKAAHGLAGRLAARRGRGRHEFLPVSSTGHLTILESLLGYDIDDPDITAFTAIIQIGAVLATILYLRRDIWRIGTAWLRGLAAAELRGPDYRFGWAVILGSLPIGVAALLFKDQVETTLRSLWVVATALILWSGVMWFADRRATQERGEADVTWQDTLIIGAVAESGAHSGHLPIRSDDVGRTVARDRSRHRHPAVVLPVDPGAERCDRAAVGQPLRRDLDRRGLGPDAAGDGGQLRRRVRHR